jgi:xanthine dehydrogenase accessory factor
MFPSDHDALRAASGHEKAGLCTLLNVEGTFSRRRGAQLAILPDGATVGSLSDGCLEAQLATDMGNARDEGKPRVVRYGTGSDVIDFRLPCGGGVDILLDPAPDAAALGGALTALEARQPATLALPIPAKARGALLSERRYIPPLRVLLFGEGPEFAAFAALAEAAGVRTEARGKSARGAAGLALGETPSDLSTDKWTAILLLFHDHEWEREILRWALATPAFHIGAQGGSLAREQRVADLAAIGFDEVARARVTSPVGLIPKTRDAEVLALSALAEIVGRYTALHPHAKESALPA